MPNLGSSRIASRLALLAAAAVAFVLTIYILKPRHSPDGVVPHTATVSIGKTTLHQLAKGIAPPPSLAPPSNPAIQKSGPPDMASDEASANAAAQAAQSAAALAAPMP